jgi:hypothetical protein
MVLADWYAARCPLSDLSPRRFGRNWQKLYNSASFAMYIASDFLGGQMQFRAIGQNNGGASMNYGNSNDIVKTCARCGESLDRHSISLIRSDDKTGRVARKLQAELDRVVKQGKLRGTDPTRVACMVGAASARIGTADYMFAAISGADIDILRHLNGNALGAGVTLVREHSALPLSTITNKPLVLTQPVPWGRNRDYPVGACAAQKLLMAIFKAQRNDKGKISAINLSEILWSNPALGSHNRDWSTGSVVCSCDTCKRVVPQMLCDLAE